MEAVIIGAGEFGPHERGEPIALVARHVHTPEATVQ